MARRARGATAAYGRYVVMGDADGSYDFREAVSMVGELMQGAPICAWDPASGSHRAGCHAWKNRYIGNPILTGITQHSVRTNISDAHCGLRASTRTTFDHLQLSGDGMEFAS
jgi:hypothetical protein